jgi:hypothetical protein
MRTLIGKCVALACIGALAACSGSDKGEVTSDELQVLFPNGTTGPFELGRVSVHVQCTGAMNDYFGQDPVDGADFWTDLEFENQGQDGMEVWHAFMDLLGDCLFSVFAYEPDGELFCTGQGGTNVQPGDNDKVAVVLNCDVSQNIDTGMVDFDATPVLAVGNFCPLFHSLELIPDDIPITPPPLEIPNPNLPNDASTELTVCMFDTADLNQDPNNFVMSSCGSRCDVTPDPARITLTCMAEVIDAIGGNVIGPSSGTFSDPVNGGLGQDGDGDPTTYNGLCLGGQFEPLLYDSIGYFSCDTTNEPGVAIRITCCGGDGDEDCDKCKTHDLLCPGENQCANDPCNDQNVCTQDLCDPATGGCQNVPQPGTSCTTSQGGPGTCDANGACQASGCSTDAECETADPCTTSTCNVGTGVCNNAVPDNEGGTCDDNGNPGTCQSGVCTGLCAGVSCPADPNECLLNACDPADGQCKVSNNDGASCNNGAGVCQNGQCEVPATCDAGGAAPADCLKDFFIADDCALLANSAAIPLDSVVTQTAPAFLGVPLDVVPQAAIVLPADLVCGFLGAGFTAVEVANSSIGLTVNGAAPGTIPLASHLPGSPHGNVAFDFTTACGNPAGSGPGIVAPFLSPTAGNAVQINPSAAAVDFLINHADIQLNLVNLQGPFVVPSLCVGGACASDSCGPEDRDGDQASGGPNDSPRIMYDANCTKSEAALGNCAPFAEFAGAADVCVGRPPTTAPTVCNDQATCCAAVQQLYPTAGAAQQPQMPVN